MAKKNKKEQRKLEKQKAREAERQKQQKKGFSFSTIWTNQTNRLLIQFLLIILVFYLIWPSGIFQDYIVAPVSTLYAQASGLILKVFGYPVKAIGNSLSERNFSINIQNGCDGIEGLAIFYTAVLIFPTSWNNKMKGLLFGTLFLVLLNLFRIISLYLFKAHAPDLFEFMHVSVWQVLFIGLTLLALFYWIGWTNKQKLTHE